MQVDWNIPPRNGSALSLVLFLTDSGKMEINFDKKATGIAGTIYSRFRGFIANAQRQHTKYFLFTRQAAGAAGSNM